MAISKTRNTGTTGCSLTSRCNLCILLFFYICEHDLRASHNKNIVFWTIRAYKHDLWLSSYKNIVLYQFKAIIGIIQKKIRKITWRNPRYMDGNNLYASCRHDYIVWHSQAKDRIFKYPPNENISLYIMHERKQSLFVLYNANFIEVIED